MTPDEIEKVAQRASDLAAEKVWGYTFSPVTGWVARRADYVLGQTWNQAILANNRATQVSTLVQALVPRVATLQAAVDGIAKVVSAPAKVAIDAATVADQVATKVIGAVKSLTWKAGA